MFFKMEHCDVYYGQIQALYDINVEINPSEISFPSSARTAQQQDDPHEEHHGPRPRQERQDRLAG